LIFEQNLKEERLPVFLPEGVFVPRGGLPLIFSSTSYASAFEGVTISPAAQLKIIIMIGQPIIDILIYWRQP
jgi:hypothetical protein